MNYLVYFIKIILFFSFSFIVYYYATKDKKDRKIKGVHFVFLCLLYIGYSFIITKQPFILDKKIYALKFSSDIYSSQVYKDSIGLWGISKFLHIFTYNPVVLFSTIAFLFFSMTLIAYNKYNNKATPYALLLIGVSEYYLYGFYLLKQCISIGLIALLFVEYFTFVTTLGKK